MVDATDGRRGAGRSHGDDGHGTLTASGTHVLVLPGGGYSQHAPHEAEPVVEWLAGLGIRASVFRYPLHARHPVPLQALRREIRRRRDAGADRIGIVGFSAGGHLAGLAALAPRSDERDSVDFVVMGYAITSMETETYRPARIILLGAHATPPQRREVSLDALVTPSAPPFFIWHTAEDIYVPPEHTLPLRSGARVERRCPHRARLRARTPQPRARPRHLAMQRSGQRWRRLGSPRGSTRRCLSATPEGLRVSTGLRLSTQSSFWVITALLLALFSSAGAPAPLYQVYQANWGFSTTTLTLVFAVYVLTLLATLLTVGSLSDHAGRRPVMVAAIATAAVASGLFLTADGVTALILARATQGVAIGLTSGSLVAAMLDLRPEGESGPLLSSVAPTAGLAIGALVTSGLVEYGPHPTRLIWSLLLAVFVMGVALVLAMPEPGRRRPGAIASLRPRLGVPASARSAFAVAAPCVIGLWALGGFYLSLGPSLARELVHSSNLMWGGLSICLLTGFGAIASAATRHQLPRVTMIAGCGGLLVGVAITVAAIATGARVAAVRGNRGCRHGIRNRLLRRLPDRHRRICGG